MYTCLIFHTSCLRFLYKLSSYSFKALRVMKNVKQNKVCSVRRLRLTIVRQSLGFVEERIVYEKRA